MFSTSEIKSICKNYNINCISVGKLIDTSKSEDDKRFNYLINDAYFLKINNIKSKNENFLSDIQLLIENYRSIDVYCPSLCKSKDNTFSFKVVKDEIEYICHLEEKSPYPIRDEQLVEDYQFKKEVLEHLGKLASKFSNSNLSQNKSMWSLIELFPSDTDVDEKQENFNDLIKCLKKYSHIDLVYRLNELNSTCRQRIIKSMKVLPRCVYQGDLNNSNIVVSKHGKFKGIIDFNLFGTEVNINCFLNESMYYLTKEDFDALSAKQIFVKMTNTQDHLMNVILKHYRLNNDELDIMNDYKKIVFTSFYPNVMLMIKLIEKNICKEKVIEFIDIILDS